MSKEFEEIKKEIMRLNTEEKRTEKKLENIRKLKLMCAYALGGGKMTDENGNPFFEEIHI